MVICALLRTTFAMSSETEVFEADSLNTAFIVYDDENNQLNTAFIVYDDEADDDTSVNLISPEEEASLEEALDKLNGMWIYAKEFVLASSD